MSVAEWRDPCIPPLFLLLPVLAVTCSRQYWNRLDKRQGRDL